MSLHRGNTEGLDLGAGTGGGKLVLVVLGEVLSVAEDLLGGEETRLGRALHRVDVVLVRVAAREEKVGDGGALIGPELVHPGCLAVERLLKLNNV